MARPTRKTRSTKSTTDSSIPSNGSETTQPVAESSDSVSLNNNAAPLTSTEGTHTPTNSMPSGPPMDLIETELNYSNDSADEEVLTSEHEEVQVVSYGPASSSDIHPKQSKSVKPELQSLPSPTLPHLPSPAEIENKMKALVKTLDNNTSIIATNFKLNSGEVSKLAFKSGGNIIDYFSSLDDYVQDCVVSQSVIIQVMSKILNVTELNQLTPTGLSSIYFNHRINGVVVVSSALLDELVAKIAMFLSGPLAQTKFKDLRNSVAAFKYGSSPIVKATIKILGFPPDTRTTTLPLPVQIYLLKKVGGAANKLVLSTSLLELEKILIGANIAKDWDNQTSFSNTVNFIESFNLHKEAVEKYFNGKLSIIAGMIWTRYFVPRMGSANKNNFTVAMVEAMNNSAATGEPFDPTSALHEFVRNAFFRGDFNLVKGDPPVNLEKLGNSKASIVANTQHDGTKGSGSGNGSHSNKKRKRY